MSEEQLQFDLDSVTFPQMTGFLERDLTPLSNSDCDHLDLAGMSWFYHHQYCPNCGKGPAKL